MGRMGRTALECFAVYHMSHEHPGLTFPVFHTQVLPCGRQWQAGSFDSCYLLLLLLEGQVFYLNSRIFKLSGATMSTSDLDLRIFGIIGLVRVNLGKVNNDLQPV